MTFIPVQPVFRWWCLWLVLLGLAACARVAAPERVVVKSRPALHEETRPPCLQAQRTGRQRVLLWPPAGGWSGAPQAVVVMNVFRGQVKIRHGQRERCGVLQDARTLDSRFLSGMGTVLVPGKGNQRPIEVEFEPSPMPLWRPIVRLGEPASVQRQDTLRFALRVASVAVMLALVVSALLTFVSTRERAFLSYALGASLFALWMALLSGLWAYPQPWFALGELSLRLVGALPTMLSGLTVRMLAYHAAPRALAARVRRGADWLVPCAFALATAIVLVPEHWLAVTSLGSELGFYLLCLAMAGMALVTMWRGEPGALEHLAAASASARHTGQPTAVGFLDIDYFKDINDMHGHEVGDQVLRAFARILRSTFRGADYVARMGGEEFLVVLPGASAEQAKARIESLSPLLATIGQSLHLPQLRVTLSAGVTEVNAGDLDIVPLLQRADAAMYAAKRAGRDQVVLSSQRQD
jgi:diguanylate cyclase (GGDEF)-like protein